MTFSDFAESWKDLKSVGIDSTRLEFLCRDARSMRNLRNPWNKSSKLTSLIQLKNSRLLLLILIGRIQ